MKKLWLIWSVVAMCLVPMVVEAATGILTWPANTVGAEVGGYNVYCGKASGVYNAPIKLGLVTTYSVDLPTLTVDQMYFCAITALGLTGLESGKSNEVSKLVAGVPVVIVPPVVLPVLITDFKAVTVNGKTTLSWTLVGPATLSALRVHKVGTPYDPCTSTVYCPQAGETITSWVSNLAPGDYDAWVHGLVPNNVWNPAQGLKFTVPIPVPVPPAIPGGLKISKATDSEVVITASIADCPNVLATQLVTLTQHTNTITCTK